MNEELKIDDKELSEMLKKMEIVSSIKIKAATTNVKDFNDLFSESIEISRDKVTYEYNALTQKFEKNINQHNIHSLWEYFVEERFPDLSVFEEIFEKLEEDANYLIHNNHTVRIDKTEVATSFIDVTMTMINGKKIGYCIDDFKSKEFDDIRREVEKLIPKELYSPRFVSKR